MSALDRLHASFPDGVPIPELLVRLASYQDARNRLPGKLEFDSDGYQAALDWTNDNEQEATQFVLFLIDNGASDYGYWRYNRQLLDQAPLVYLGGEGVDNTVLANSLEDFVRLIALGPPNIGMWRKSYRDVEASDDTLRFREWLRTETGIVAPTSEEAREIIETARYKHPDIDQWVQEQWE